MSDWKLNSQEIIPKSKCSLCNGRARMLKTKRRICASVSMATSYPLLCSMSRWHLLWSEWRELSDKEKSLRDGASAAGRSNINSEVLDFWVSMPQILQIQDCKAFSQFEALHRFVDSSGNLPSPPSSMAVSYNAQCLVFHRLKAC